MLQPEPKRTPRAQDPQYPERGADVVATGNIGCITQLERGSAVPVVHTIELLDWATGGPCPKPLERLKDKVHPIESLMELAGAR
jgi:glycolate oxidase iron-sulfur subunit